MKRTIWNVCLFCLCLTAALFIVACHVANTQAKKGEVKIGAILPLTGPSAIYGQYIKRGIDLAIDETNATGGINGDSLKIVYEDDQAQPKFAVAAISKLAEVEHIPIVIGPWASSCVMAIAPIAEKTKTVVMAIAISPEISKAGDYIFRIQPSAQLYAEALAPYLFDEAGVRKLAILYVNNDFGVSQAASMRHYFESRGGKIVLEKGFPSGTTDFRAELAELRDVSPDAVFVPAYTEVALFLKQAREMRIHSLFAASVPFENPDILRIAGSAAEGVVYPYHYAPDPTNEQDRVFRAKFTQRYAEEPDGFAALAYDATRIIVTVMRTRGTSPDQIKEGLYGVRDFMGVTGKTTFDSNGDVIKPIIIKTVTNGHFVAVPHHESVPQPR